MDDISLSIARNMFHLQVYESDGVRFEDLFSKIMYYKSPGFQQVKPHGNVGDRKNDGFIKDEGVYYQVYAPEDASNNVLTAVNKIKDDFQGLMEYWHDICPIKKYYFVLNDKYKGSLPQLHKELINLQRNFNLIDTGVFVAKDLERDLFNLPDDMIRSVVGHLPDIDHEEYMFVSGFTCFISAWINFEKVARYNICSVKEPNRPLFIGRIVDVLVQNKIISTQDAAFIKHITQIRNRLVHGVSMIVPKKSEIDVLILITERVKLAGVYRLE
ncbi:hypothetical protein Entcl_1718 [[Enterobacter] lignolyticus SCF1]|uniref:Uncharacterized protein n=2 Tax=[Enterobacter] lignolyticus TaxID=1334193 RepID=E3G162_ENTLS|nr:hypothetical protein Entcl_1718 [[Enterobacter] lignolyticus SCF1]